MKRYHVYAENRNDPRGGWYDWNSSYDDLQDAREQVNRLETSYDFAYIIDMETEQEII